MKQKLSEMIFYFDEISKMKKVGPKIMPFYDVIGKNFQN